MKSRKLLVVYIVLLACVLIAMFRLWPYKQEPVPPRDYPEIKSEGILRMVTEYNQSGYYVAGDTIEGFQYELSQAIAALSGLEVQTQLEMSLAESFKQLSDNQCDVIARNIPITSDIKEDYLFTDPIVFNKHWCNARKKPITASNRSVTSLIWHKRPCIFRKTPPPYCACKIWHTK